MKKPLITFLLFLFCIPLTAQHDSLNKLAAPIVEEGKLLYRLEYASWHGTDIFLPRFKDRAKLGGYFSYTAGDSTVCVFFSKKKNPKVVGTIIFNSDLSLTMAELDLKKRAFTSKEKELHSLRQAAFIQITTDTFFIHHKNTNFNMIPLIRGDTKEVYVLTGPTQNGIIIFGNDYLLKYDQSNNLLSKKRLHNNILVTDINKDSEGGIKTVAGMHNHNNETGLFITATDICTLMLYWEFADWKTYMVISEKYINIWNCEAAALSVMKQEGMFKR